MLNTLKEWWCFYKNTIILRKPKIRTRHDSILDDMLADAVRCITEEIDKQILEELRQKYEDENNAKL